MKIERIKDLIQSCHINFLLGSGISRPFLSTLGNIETLLTDLSNCEELEKDKQQLIKASIYKLYFEEVMWPNHQDYDYEISTIENDKGTKDAYDIVFENYSKFFVLLNEILLYRYSSILNKQINLFTTNIDLFIEETIEATKLEFNDGFSGRLKPTYDLSNFQKSYSKTSLHYENKSEIPVFNILKVHGSLTWEKGRPTSPIKYSKLNHLKKVNKRLNEINTRSFLEISNKSTLVSLIEDSDKIEIKKDEFKNFLSEYEKILVVNPTKEKFQKTLIDDKFYELLRLYANSLEKENSLMFVLGFSFADEHIRDITLRAANSNPTLQIIVFAHNRKAKRDIENELNLSLQKNNNIAVISPDDFIKSNSKDENEETKLKKRLNEFDFTTILNEVFKPITNLIRIKAEV